MSSTDFSQGLIHAVRTELTVINFAQSDVERRKATRSLETLLMRAELYNSLRVSDAHKSVNIKNIIEDVFSNISQRRLSRIRIHESDIFIHADKHQLAILVYELVDNALRYSMGDIRISIHKLTNQILIRIEDSGPGLPDEILANIAVPFSAHTIRIGRKNLVKGFGLGLSIAQKIVELNSGSMTLVAGKDGTTASITLDVV